MKQGNLEGTLKDQFALGKEEEHGVRIVDGEVALFDPISGQKKMSELGVGDSILAKIVMTTEGGMVYNNETQLVVHG